MFEKLIIGTVQFGLDYGITNTDGKVNKEELDKIFNFCNDNKIFYFDTAQDYGNSEDIMSEQLKVHPKFKIITKCKFKNKNYDEVITKSINKFESIEYFLFHSYEDYSKESIEKLNFYKKQGFIKKIGVSLYTVEEAILLLDDPLIDVLQIPFNYIDNQWDNQIFKEKLKNRSDVEIHVRSIFLQGILLNPIVKQPINIPEKDFINLNNIIDSITGELGLSKLELCFGYINSIKWIDKFLIGIDNFKHLELNYSIINQNIKLSEKDILNIKEKTNNINQLICNPSKWKFI